MTSYDELLRRGALLLSVLPDACTDAVTQHLLDTYSMTASEFDASVATGIFKAQQTAPSSVALTMEILKSQYAMESV